MRPSAFPFGVPDSPVICEASPTNDVAVTIPLEFITILGFPEVSRIVCPTGSVAPFVNSTAPVANLSTSFVTLSVDIIYLK